jgi:hypothetical protein
LFSRIPTATTDNQVAYAAHRTDRNDVLPLLQMRASPKASRGNWTAPARAGRSAVTAACNRAWMTKG